MTNKKPKRYFLTYLWTWIPDVIVWLIVLIVRLTGGMKLNWLDGLWCEYKEDSWVSAILGKSNLGITLGHGGLYREGVSGGEGIDTLVEYHEQEVHVEQYEAAMLTGWVVAILATVAVFVENFYVKAGILGALWVFGWLYHYGATMVQAWLRGEAPYWGSHLEEAAYALTDQYAQKVEKEESK